MSRQQLIQRAKRGDRSAQVALLRQSVRQGRVGTRELAALVEGCDAVALALTGRNCGDSALLKTSGRKTRFKGEQAEAVIRAYYSDKGFKDDPRSRGKAMISADGKARIVFKPRSWQRLEGGRGKWRKVESGSKKQLAERLVRQAKGR